MLLSGFWDTSGTLNVYEVAAIVTTVSFIAVGIGWLIEQGRKKLRDEIAEIVDDKLAEYTAPIQKTANGGLSLPDVARATRWNQEALYLIAKHQGIHLPPKQ